MGAKPLDKTQLIFAPLHPPATAKQDGIHTQVREEVAPTAGRVIVRGQMGVAAA